MGRYGPQTVAQLGSVVDDICRALQNDGASPLSPKMKQALAKRVLELFESGITEPEQLTLGVMAESLWATGPASVST